VYKVSKEKNPKPKTQPNVRALGETPGRSGLFSHTCGTLVSYGCWKIQP